MDRVEVVLEAKNELGEGPIWNVKEQALYWVDSINTPAIQRLDPATGARMRWAMPDDIGSMVFRENGQVLAGFRSGFKLVDLKADGVCATTDLGDPEPDTPETRLNDGKCDRAGRYWTGSLDETLQPRGKLYRMDPDFSWTRMEEGVITSNGIAWSPDNSTMYYSCSKLGLCHAYDFDFETGAMSNKRVFIDVRDVPADIDGATVDSEGYYWCANVRDWHVARYAPDGRLERRIKLPVSHPTMCTFGGPNLDVLYVTSGVKFLDAEQRKEQPLAGSLFAITDTGATGIPEPFFAG